MWCLQPTSFPSMAEELQFYYQVMRKFQSLFFAQESAANCYTYDKMPEVYVYKIMLLYVLEK